MNRKKIIILITLLITLSFSACTGETKKAEEVNTLTGEEQMSSTPTEDLGVIAEPTPEPISENTPIPDDYVIDWIDPELEAAMRVATGIGNRDIMYGDVKNITELNLNSLYGIGNKDMIPDISALSNLTNLKVLYLYDNQISDISVLGYLTNLEQLYLDANQISDISVLSNLTNLEILHINYNQISDISALANLTNLRELSLYNNQISDVSPLSNLMNLEALWLFNNPITDYLPVNHVPDVRY